MIINRPHKRPLEVSRGSANRDPMFTGHWYGPDEPLTAPTPSEPEPELPLELPPLPPPNPNEEKWRAVLDLAVDVTALLKPDPDFDGLVLSEVANSLVGSDPTAADIVAAYYKRMEARRNATD